ncbi:hypothetical protein [Mesorhizobium cantuariense]|uniref:Uncharacterized protein n=1 Tax=Mesorhizobium cantuariense TaxID=1300275 RepID=A0ABV7MNI5_9HYPH
MANGVCKLTGQTGKLVKSHILPKALTLSEQAGLPLIQGGHGRRAVRRWHSWYDRSIVTEAGEEILSFYDDWAIKYLRSNKLVWSGWGPMMALGQLHSSIPNTPWGARKITMEDPTMLRLFLLSLLWRAAVSTLEEMSEVILTPTEIEQLRRMLIDRNPEPFDLFAASLTQFSTIGIIHNMTPLAEDKYVPKIGESAEYYQPMFRFYFDGLVVHFHRDDRSGMAASGLIPTFGARA